METLPGGLQLNIPQGAFPLSTDSMVLADFVKLSKNARIADLGSGCGTLGLLLCSKSESCHVTGFELNENAHQAALENIAANGLSGRMESIPGDLRQTVSAFPNGSFDVVLSNPPYYAAGPESKHGFARREDTCSLAEILQAMGDLLKFGKDGYLVHKPERLGEIIALGQNHQLTAKELVLVRHKEGGSIALVMVKLRKGAAQGLIIRELSLYDCQGNQTPAFRRIYHTEGD